MFRKRSSSLPDIELFNTKRLLNQHSVYDNFPYEDDTHRVNIGKDSQTYTIRRKNGEPMNRTFLNVENKNTNFDVSSVKLENRIPPRFAQLFFLQNMICNKNVFVLRKRSISCDEYIRTKETTFSDHQQPHDSFTTSPLIMQRKRPKFHGKSALSLPKHQSSFDAREFFLAKRPFAHRSQSPGSGFNRFLRRLTNTAAASESIVTPGNISSHRLIRQPFTQKGQSDRTDLLDHLLEEFELA